MRFAIANPQARSRTRTRAVRPTLNAYASPILVIDATADFTLIGSEAIAAAVGALQQHAMRALDAYLLVWWRTSRPAASREAVSASAWPDSATRSRMDKVSFEVPRIVRLSVILQGGGIVALTRINRTVAATTCRAPIRSICFLVDKDQGCTRRKD